MMCGVVRDRGKTAIVSSLFLCDKKAEVLLD